MAKIYMYAHGGRGNHGCEAIVRSTCDMLNNPLWDEILLISSKTEEDIKEWLSLNLEAYLEDGNLYAFVRSLEYVV